MTDTPTITLWSFPDDWYEDGGRAILEGAGGRERTFRQWTNRAIDQVPVLWVEVSDGAS